MTSEGTPGEAYHYNGDRYLLLDQVIKEASGKSFQELLIERILTPLNMSRTAPSQAGLVEIDPHADTFASIYADLAKPYTLSSDCKIIDGEYPSHFSTAAGLISTVEDLAKFDDAIDQDILISEKMRKKMFAPTRSNHGIELPYGLGWYSQEFRGMQLNWHWGQWNCVSSLMVKVPDEEISFIILANSENLSKPFDLGQGNAFRSPFASVFYEVFFQQRR
jgi:CubicO group peptidase (beta-lactamase class C family)